MAARKKTGRKAAKKKAGGRTSTAEPVDPRTPLQPGPKAFKQVLADVDATLADVPPPEEPAKGDLVEAMMHYLFARGLPCGHGQEALRRIEEAFVDRNEFRVTEAFEVEGLMTGLDLPDAFERCLQAQEAVAQVYNDQNAVSLDFLREASVTDRNNFFARVPAIDPETTQFLVNYVSWEEVAFSERSTLRTQQRLGVDPKNPAVKSFIEELRARLKPYGHLPVLVNAAARGRKPDRRHELCAGCALVRLGPEAKKKRR